MLNGTASVFAFIVFIGELLPHFRVYAFVFFTFSSLYFKSFFFFKLKNNCSKLNLKINNITDLGKIQKLPPKF